MRRFVTLVAVVGLGACGGTGGSGEPATPVEPPTEEPTPEPEPEPVVFPDGTVVLDCEQAPAGTACVPGSQLIRGADTPDECPQPENPAEPVNHQPQATVWVQTFYMDVTEVTYEAYKACEAAGDCNRAGPRYRDFNRPQQPLVGPSWYDAIKYCQAQGKHLPTEAEWELAARGPDGEIHPWGNEPATCERAVIMDETGRSCGVEKQHGQAHKGRTFEVASKPPARHGLYDMVGNAEEWVADWYAKTYERCGEDCTGVNPRGPCGGADRCPGHHYKVVKGGSWYWPAECATGFNRRRHVPSNDPYHHFGFRCAASVEEAQAIIALAETAPPSPADEAPAEEVTAP